MIKTLPPLRVPMLLFLIVCCGAWCISSAGPPSQGTERTLSPHGMLEVPCEKCHTTEGWKPIRRSPDFDHRSTRYPLQGMHKDLECNDCHLKLAFSDIGTQCAECHADIHRRLMGSDCEECHSARGWLQIKQVTNGHENRFPLWGAHASVQCEGCHKNAAVGLYRGLSIDCASCHLEDYRSAKNPDHLAAGFSTRCETCHGYDSWTGGFDHAHFTGFALEGVHAQLDCVQCHAGGVFTGTPATCVGCHLQDYNSTTNPNHRTAGFSDDCAACHNTIAWIPSTFSHNATAFPLTGAHTTVPCVNCHVSGIYVGTPTDCYACHSSDYNSTTDPNHVAASFPNTCAVCHSTTAWTPAVFNHSGTAFPLTGAHTTVPCASCHGTGIYAGTPTDCYACHSSDYNSATDPNHVAASFPNNCTVCHSTTAWTPSTFNHSTSAFPLTGAHTTVPCANCHVSGIYAGTPTDCYSCHSSEYNSTTDPNHAAAAFPRTCSDCHSTSTWSGATFSHTQFPIYSGTHAGRWSSCNDCHTNASNYAVFTCTTSCHPKSETDSEHREVSNYVYNSANCYSCHPTGRGGD
jgi:hypothetical protein